MEPLSPFDLFHRIPTSFDAFNTFRRFSVRIVLEGCGNNMIAEEIDVPARLHDVLRPLGITRSMKAHRILCGCVERIDGKNKTYVFETYIAAD